MLNTTDINKFTQTAVDQTKEAFENASKQADELRSKFDTIIKNSFDTSKLDLSNPLGSLPGPSLPEIMETITGYTLVTRNELGAIEERLAKAEKALAAKKATPRKATAKKAAPRKAAAKKAVSK